MARRPIIIGNWKMNKTIGESLALVNAICESLDRSPDVDAGVAPPFCAIAAVATRRTELKKSQLIVAAQNCHSESSGAFTGEISVEMLADAGCSHVIIGHSERRQYFAETDDFINKKLHAVIKASLTPVLCIGETLEQRDAGKTFDVVSGQLLGALRDVSDSAARTIVVAYEPVWAIGTGKTATPSQAQEVHAFLRAKLVERYDSSISEQIRIQYGGSVKPDNVSELMQLPDVDGALVGGASLKPESFIALLNYTG